MPAVAFAIPYYRGPDYLRAAVASVFAQASADWELVVSDDGGDGHAAGVLADFPDPRVRYHRNPAPLGMAGNWNRCLDLASADLVTLLHADDELLPNYAADMTRHAAAFPAAAAVFCRAVVIGPDGRRVFSLPDLVKDVLAPPRPTPRRVAGEAGLAALLRGNFVMCPTVCYRRSVVGGRRFDPRWRMVLDLDYFARLVLAGDELVGSPAVGYAYRRHPANATAAYTASLLRFREEFAVYDELADAAAARGWRRAARVGRAKAIVRLHLGYRAAEDLSRGRVRAAAAKLALAAAGRGR